MDRISEASGAARGSSRGATVRRVSLLLLAAGFALQSYLLLSHSQAYRPRATGPLRHFQDMVDGDGPRPFVTRALVPYAIRVTGDLVDPERIGIFVAPLRAMGFTFPRDTQPGLRGHIDPRDFAVWMYLAILSLFLLGEGIHRVLRYYYRGPPWLFEVAAAVSLLLWPVLISYASYLIDVFTPTLVMWTLYMAIRRRWLAYHALLILAAVHKETMIVIPLAVLYLDFNNRPWRRFLPIIGLQMAGVLAIRAYLSLSVFAENPGGLTQFHFFDHTLSANVWRMFAPEGVLIAVLLLGVVLRDLSSKPRGCKALAIVVWPLVLLGSFLGYFDEIRQYSEAYPGLVCLAFPTLASAFRRDIVQRRSEPV